MKKIIIAISVLISSLAMSAQEQLGNGMTIDKQIHDFGDILLENGPVSCTFTIQNNGEKPAVIYNVVSS